ncbi:homeobox protein NANOG [Suncus etruscus]|uniref:homeobox protein NANOG n=1 Tax=Suncus etruscus TaxID=109475 RepID=UPI0021109645|nr:homeobox protein NANOG [Suncus etruscus]
MSAEVECAQDQPYQAESDVSDASPKLQICEGEEKEEEEEPLPMVSAETTQLEMVSPPSSMDLPVQDSPDSSTSPKVPPVTEEKPVRKKDHKVLGRKQKSRTKFSQTQLCVLNDRFQKQKYLSLQQMQELSAILNLSYKQVKTWFQNQRMKYKRWQKNNWPKNSNGVAQTLLPAECSGFCYHQRCLVNTPDNLTAWSGQPWNSNPWVCQEWNNQAWNNQAWHMQTWSGQFPNYGEDPLQQTLLPFQQNLPADDLESILETSVESQNIIPQTIKYFSTQQVLDFPPNYSMNMPLGDV